MPSKSIQTGVAPVVTPQYVLCERIGSKIVAVAGITLGDQSCLRRAECAFEEAGFDTRALSTKWGSVVTSQKNFVGYKTDFIILSPNASARSRQVELATETEGAI